MKSNHYIPRMVEDYAFDETLTGRHMVFLAGPRQVGKTVLARQWLKKRGCAPLYFNWDDISTRQAYLADSRFFESPARSLGIQDPSSPGGKTVRLRGISVYDIGEGLVRRETAYIDLATLMVELGVEL